MNASISASKVGCVFAMPQTISSIADRASAFYRGRAFSSSIEDNAAMQNDDWRARLTATLKEKNLSKREVSLNSGNGQGYVHSILSEGKEPTIKNLEAVCAALNVSLSYILYGFDVTPEDEGILAAMHESPEKRDAVITLLGQRKAG